MFLRGKGNEEFWSVNNNQTIPQGSSFGKSVDIVYTDREKSFRQCYIFKRIKGKRNRGGTKKKKKKKENRFNQENEALTGKQFNYLSSYFKTQDKINSSTASK